MTTCTPPADRRISPALLTQWQNLRTTEGESIHTTWEEWFSTLAEAPKFRGDLAHPGWSAAAVEPCVRNAANVVGLSALVLDYDSGTTLDEAAALWGEHFGFIHTSRKHKPDAPRFRVILPLTRVVTPDDYAVIWRWAQRVATGANQRIDPATKDPARFWYLPGIASGGVYETRRLGGEPVDPDPIVQAHRYAENERTAPASQPSGDLEKRASRYLARLPEAISGSGGHQALWAAALALVRGFRIPAGRALTMLRDEYNPRCKPAWSERELLHKVSDAERDATTAYGYLADKVRAAPAPTSQPDPEPDYVPDVPPDHYDPPELEMPPAPRSAPKQASPSDWQAALSVTPQGAVRKTFDNLCRILEHHEAYGDRLSFDEMRLTPLLGDRAVSDADVGRIRREVEQHFGFGPAEADVRAALCTVADARKFHPVQRYLRSLTWDGVERISQVVPDCLRAKNTPLAQQMVRKWFISAVARALKPGCKVDTSLVLVGPQRALKSTFFSILGGEWFADTHMDITDKDGLLQLHSAWIYEWAEIENVTTNRRAGEVKAFASSPSDTFRPPFGKAVGVHPRSTVIVGTTNEAQFLNDATGSRRFWVVRVGDRIAREWVAEHRDQLWAEAARAYLAGQSWWLDEDGEVAREDDADQYQLEDPWEQPVAEWLAGPGKAGAVTMHRILADALKLPAAQETRATEGRVAAILRRLGFVPVQGRVSGAKIRHWMPRRVPLFDPLGGTS